MERTGGPGLTSVPLPSSRSGGRALAISVSVCIHLAVIAALLGLHFTPSPAPEKQSVTTMLVPLGPVPDAAGSTDGADRAAPPPLAPTPLPDIAVPAVTITRPSASDTSDLLSDSQIAGAAQAGEGGMGGGGCDMARAVQQVLRRDPRVRAAVADAGRAGKASMLWNGDWVRAGGQEGKGLAVVRQAIIWEIGFAPEPCRNAPVRGLVVLSLADGGTRFAIGAGFWRWSDLLGLRQIR